LVICNSPLFITWTKKSERNKNEYDLRGCIGSFQELDLHSGLKEYALISALQDSRFSPISLNEIEHLKVSVSLLVEFEEANGWNDWEIGKHGIRIHFTPSDGGRAFSATYLPEVAAEQRWDHRESIVSLVKKSGYRGKVTEKLLSRIRIVRYQSSKHSISYEEYVSICT